MTPFKRGEFYYIDLRPEGYPHRLALSTRQGAKRTAQQFESTIRTLAQHGRFDALDGLREKRYTVADLHAAHAAGTLDALVREATDPPLRKATARFLAGVTDRRYRRAVTVLLETAPRGARASWLLDPANLMRVVRVYRERKLSPGTERRELWGVGALIRETFGERERRRVFSELKLRKVRKRRVERYLTAEELASLREHAGEWWMVILLAAASGIRRGELLRLKRKDVDLEGGALVVDGKSDAARRRVPLAGETLGVLRGWVVSEALRPADPLFPGLTDSRLRVAWQEIREAAGIDARWHDLRHTYGVHCAASGMPMPELSRRMGHGSIDVTMIYADYAPPERSEHYEQALARMGLEGDTGEVRQAQKIRKVDVRRSHA